MRCRYGTGGTRYEQAFRTVIRRARYGNEGNGITTSPARLGPKCLKCLRLSRRTVCPQSRGPENTASPESRNGAVRSLYSPEPRREAANKLAFRTEGGALLSGGRRMTGGWAAPGFEPSTHRHHRRLVPSPITAQPFLWLGTNPSRPGLRRQPRRRSPYGRGIRRAMGCRASSQDAGRRACLPSRPILSQ